MRSDHPRRPGDAPAPPGRAPKTVSSAELLGEQRELRILHQGEHYVLRLTRLGKLILTK